MSSEGWWAAPYWVPFSLCLESSLPSPHPLLMSQSSPSQRWMLTSSPNRVNVLPLPTRFPKLGRGKKLYLLGFMQHMVWTLTL